MKKERSNFILKLGIGFIILNFLSTGFILANGHGGNHENGINREKMESKVMERGGKKWGGEEEYKKVIDYIKNSEKGSLTEWEREYLAFRLEEEKAARDVYITLSEKWGKPFENIKKSEQWHMNIMEALREKYGFENDYLTKNKVGVFENQKFQDLYNQLIEKGLKSEKDAMEVGMLIEDMDIADLDNSLKKVKNEDLKFVLEKFVEASSHHMQAFHKKLEKIGGVYEPEYISKDRMKVALEVPKKNSDLKENKEKNVKTIVGDSDRKEENMEKSWWEIILDWLIFWK